VVFQANPDRVCRECGVSEGETTDGIAKKVVDSGNVYIIASMMRDVIRAGTGTRALVLNRHDLSGKTGTTNDQKDAWFSGFNANIVTTAWVGFDQIRPLGTKETGGQAALPMWIDYMRVALEGMPESLPIKPSGIITVNVDKQTGLLANSGQKGSYLEIFRKENAPTRRSAGDDPESGGTESGEPEQLF
jgi:penicillin-binding protein 1A